MNAKREDGLCFLLLCFIIQIACAELMKNVKCVTFVLHSTLAVLRDLYRFMECRLVSLVAHLVFFAVLTTTSVSYVLTTQLTCLQSASEDGPTSFKQLFVLINITFGRVRAGERKRQ